MHFKHSNAEHTYIEDGKRRTYKICDICGAEQQNNYGLEVSLARSGVWGSYRMGLCGKCANKILPILEGALDEIYATADIMRNDPNVTRRKINPAIMLFGETTNDD